MAMLGALNLSDGQHSLLDIADRSGLAFPAVRRAFSSDLLRGTRPVPRGRRVVRPELLTKGLAHKT